MSVIIPAWNASPFIEESINSVLNQSHRELELIIVDDGSTDNTAQVVQGFTDSRVKLVQLSNNQGQAAALLRGVSESSGEWIARLDSDDLSSRGRLSYQLRAARALGMNHILGSSALLFGQGKGYVSKRVTHAQLHAQLFFHSPLIHSSVFAHRSILERFPYNPEFMLEDFDWYERAVRAGVRLFNLPLPLVRYRQHEAMKSKNLGGRTRGDTLAIAARFFSDLGIDPSPSDLSIHYALAVKQATVLDDSICRSDLVDWKHRLTEANNRMRVFSRRYFKQLVLARTRILISELP